MRSIRRRLLVSTGLPLVLLLGLAAVGSWRLTSDLLTAQFDQSLRAKQLTLLNEVDLEGEDELRPVMDPDVAMAREFQAGSGEQAPNEFFQVWLGEFSERSASLGTANLIAGHSAEKGPRCFDVELPGGRRGRAICTRQTFAESKPDESGYAPGVEFELCYARGRADLDRWLLRFQLGGLAGALALIAGIALVLIQALRHGLLPLKLLAGQVDEIQEPGAAPHFDDGQQPAELVPIARGLDNLLKHLADLLERERRTSANIAHELRTPVAELLALSDPLDPPPNAHTAELRLGNISGIARQMGRLIDALLALARLEAGAVGLEPTRFALRPLLEETWAALELAAESAGQAGADPTWILEGQGDLFSDRDLFGVLVANLLANAREYGAASAPILVRILGSGEVQGLLIENQAPGLEAADLEHLSEPFWRQDRARSHRGHAGLGLALCHRLAQRLGLELTFSLHAGALRVVATRKPGPRGR